MEIDFIDKKSSIRIFSEWHSHYIAPFSEGSSLREYEDVFSRNACMRAAEAMHWVQEQLTRCSECMCIFVDSSQTVARVRRPSLTALIEIARGRDFFIVQDDEGWSAAVSGYGEWGPFVVFRPTDEDEC